MAMWKLAAGFAAGYVLGTRAGREKYAQITATARRVGAHPSVAQAQERAKSMLHSKLETAGAGARPSTRDPII